MSAGAVLAFKIVGGVYVGLCAMVFFMQKSQIYVPDNHVAYDPSVADMKFEDLRLSVGDETIHAWYIPAEVETENAVLFCHGNGGDMGDRIGTLSIFHRMGLNVMIFDYQGYGTSTGSTTEKGTYADAFAAWSFLVNEKGLKAEDICIFGRSLGGAVAMQLAEKVGPKMLTVESTFTSAPDMAARMFSFLPARTLCRYKYNNLERIKNIKCPVIVAHSPADFTIPYEHGKAVFEAANEPKHFVGLTGDHNAGGIDISPELQKRFRQLAVD